MMLKTVSQAILKFRSLTVPTHFELPVLEDETLRGLHLRVMKFLGSVPIHKETAPISLIQSNKSLSHATMRHLPLKNVSKLDEPFFMVSLLGPTGPLLLGNLREDDSVIDTTCYVCKRDLSESTIPQHRMVSGCREHCFHLLCLALHHKDACPTCNSSILPFVMSSVRQQCRDYL